MSLRIIVSTENYVTRESSQIPLFYGSFATPAIIPASVVLDLDTDITADELNFELNVCAGYKAPSNVLKVEDYFFPFITSEKLYCKKNWNVDLQPSSSKGKIAAGTYSKSIRFEINPSLPSSSLTTYHAKGQGWVKYEFKATLQKKSLGGELAPVIVTTQEIWVLNSTILPHDVLTPVNEPHIVSASWMKKTLPISLSVPSKVIHMNEHVPVTVSLGPFTKKYTGENIVVSEAYIYLRENIAGRVNGYTGFKHSRDMVSVPIVNLGGTPGPLTKTVHITFPNAPDVSADTETRYMDITHSIVLTMSIKVGKKKETEIIESPIKFIVPPQQCNTPNVEELLPAYESSSDTTHLPPSFQSLDIKS